MNIEHGFAEEVIGTLRLQLQQCALDGAYRSGRHVAIVLPQLAGAVRHVLQHRPQILEIKQQLPFIVGHLEHQVQYPCLGIIQIQHAGQQ